MQEHHYKQSKIHKKGRECANILIYISEEYFGTVCRKRGIKKKKFVTSIMLRARAD